MKSRDVKSKGEKERYKHLNAEFQGIIARRDKKAFLSDQCKGVSSQIPLPWLESNDALPLATRMETGLPWRTTRGSLTSPSYLVRNRTLGPPLENHPEPPPSSRR